MTDRRRAGPRCGHAADRPGRCRSLRYAGFVSPPRRPRVECCGLAARPLPDRRGIGPDGLARSEARDHLAELISCQGMPGVAASPIIHGKDTGRAGVGPVKPRWTPGCATSRIPGVPRRAHTSTAAAAPSTCCCAPEVPYDRAPRAYFASQVSSSTAALRGEPLAAPDESQALGGGGLDVDARARHAEIGGEIRSHGGAMRGDARRLGEHRDVGVDQPHSPPRACSAATVAQEQPAVGAAIARIACRENAGRYRPRRARPARHRTAHESRRRRRSAPPRRGGGRCARRRARRDRRRRRHARRIPGRSASCSASSGLRTCSIRAATARSAARVTLMLNGEPLHQQRHAVPAAPSPAPRRSRSRRRARPAPAPRSAAQSRRPAASRRATVPARSTVSLTDAVALALDGVDDRRREHRAARRPPSSASISVRTSPGVRHGRAASCTSTQSSGAACCASACRPFSTESWRLAPPIAVSQPGFAERGRELGASECRRRRARRRCPRCAARRAASAATTRAPWRPRAVRIASVRCAAPKPLEAFTAAGGRHDGPDTRRAAPARSLRASGDGVAGAAGAAGAAVRGRGHDLVEGLAVAHHAEIAARALLECGEADLQIASPRRATGGCARAAPRWRRVCASTAAVRRQTSRMP